MNTSRGLTASSQIVVAWLLITCATIFGMVIVGGVTRLTGSGLSMVDWQPIMGILPPMNDADWQALFLAYQQFPEYQLYNRDMNLDGFKQIFYWEYAHRVLGRVIGLLFFLPMLILWVSQQLASWIKPHLVIALVLGGLQGLMGWYMVKSGLVDDARVSHYRLAAHLLLAMGLMAYIYWLTLRSMGVHRGIQPRFAAQVGTGPLMGVPERGLRPLVLVVLGLLGVQLLYGAFTAGSHAGYGYNTFPLMHDRWIAEAVMQMNPWWHNLTESTATIQFIHRWLAVALVVAIAWLWWRARRINRALMWSSAALLAAVLVQFMMGVLTLIKVVPLGLASAHQGGACVVLLATVHVLHLVFYDGTANEQEASHQVTVE
ncbi:MAG: heme A synthase [Gammaproteobacteria bacterium]|uniref:Heme A synthase n=1 Tax=OM182 bacterium MED-G24 TaxID=1986255 RepID=A0A2A5WZD4_9GAMM|nr:heme A synthase [Gammaproteobacteria bacterium]PDH41900.1 MAG: heme A synthase [OM182 bacterium MED-G24]RPG27516.1 MAG: heme A synthase [Gammaproteobacteria bacterium TMED50]|tara:strand:- start:2779 stop:3897 length:1119 start_codon:yes stop_codon:yes gene_type:complete